VFIREYERYILVSHVWEYHNCRLEPRRWSHFVRNVLNHLPDYTESQPKGKRPLGRRRGRRVDNINMDFRGRGWDGVDWIDMAQDRDQWRTLVNTVLKLRVP
jgi:hypothetical protein